MSEISPEEAERHRAKMAKRKAVQDAEVAGKTIEEKGLLIVNTGPGKGTTTAAASRRCSWKWYRTLTLRSGSAEGTDAWAARGFFPRL